MSRWDILNRVGAFFGLSQTQLDSTPVAAPPGQSPSLNGHQTLEDRLATVLTEGYRPSLPPWALFLSDGQIMPQIYLMREIEIMMIHPVILNALDYYKGGIAGADFEGPKGLDGVAKPISQNQPLAEFVVAMCRRFWDRGVPKLQNGYEYGWIGAENLYCERQGGAQDGLLEWEGCLDFHPRDCWLLTQNARPVGVRITNVVLPGSMAAARTYDGRALPNSARDLWFSEGAVPAKGLWYVHKPRYNRFYGQSQLIAAWKPWRRLATKDAAETVLDGGFYRLAYSGPEIRYPEEDLIAPQGSSATTIGPDGKARRYARDMAREMAQWMKTGSSVGLPSRNYPAELGGGPMWEVKWGQNQFDGSPLIAYVEHLIKQIREGVGVPSELIEAAETGSGYSGRAIPLEGFLQKQQQIANAMLGLFVTQVLRPLVLWNRDYFQQYGPLDFEVCVANLLETKLKAAMNPGGAAPGMRAEGAGQPQPGQDQGGGATVTDAEGVTWQKFNGEGGQPGWKSSGGLVRYTQTPPGQLAGGMSLNDAEVARRVREIAGKILRAA